MSDLKLLNLRGRIGEMKLVVRELKLERPTLVEE
jgi:hypothetical protein